MLIRVHLIRVQFADVNFVDRGTPIAVVDRHAGLGFALQAVALNELALKAKQ